MPNPDVRSRQVFWNHPVTNSGLLGLGTPGLFDRPFESVPATVSAGKSGRTTAASRRRRSSVRTAVSAIRVGNLTITAGPGELFSNLTNTIEERESERGQTAIPISIANDGLGYIMQDFEYDPVGGQIVGFLSEDVRLRGRLRDRSLLRRQGARGDPEHRSEAASRRRAMHEQMRKMLESRIGRDRGGAAARVAGAPRSRSRRSATCSAATSTAAPTRSRTTARPWSASSSALLDFEAFRWTQTLGMLSLGDLADAAASRARANAVSGNGSVIAGYGTTATGGGGRIVDLAALRCRPVSARSAARTRTARRTASRRTAR